MNKYRVKFGKPKKDTTLGDFTGYIFPFSVVLVSVVGMPEEVSQTRYFKIVVDISGRLKAIWNLYDSDLIKVLFEYGKRHIIEKLQVGELSEYENIMLTTTTHPENIFNPDKISEPEKTIIEIEGYLIKPEIEKETEKKIDFKDFKAGIYKQQYQYKSFYPEKINKPWIWTDPGLNMMLEQASREIGELNAFSLRVPDIALFIEMHIAKEANTSSKIEGTQTTLIENIMDKESIIAEKRDDWQEVHNYIKAMNFALKKLKELPVSIRLIREVHDLLLQGVRGEHKLPGEIRRSQNWIGGSSLKDAVFIPPHHEDVPELISDLEKFLHNDVIKVPHLIKIALAHYQFETIHPFLDGNGRIGRLLITLYLANNNILKKPSLYISDFFERHKDVYYEALSRARESNDIIHWLKFFLSAVIETAEKGKNTFQKILLLREKIETDILKLNRRANKAKQLMNLLYKKPVLAIKDVSGALRLTPRSAIFLVENLVKIGVLSEITDNKRNRLYAFKEYIDLF